MRLWERMSPTSRHTRHRDRMAMGPPGRAPSSPVPSASLSRGIENSDPKRLPNEKRTRRSLADFSDRPQHAAASAGNGTKIHDNGVPNARRSLRTRLSSTASDSDASAPLSDSETAGGSTRLFSAGLNAAARTDGSSAAAAVHESPRKSRYNSVLHSGPAKVSSPHKASGPLLASHPVLGACRRRVLGVRTMLSNRTKPCRFVTQPDSDASFLPPEDYTLVRWCDSLEDTQASASVDSNTNPWLFSLPCQLQRPRQTCYTVQGARTLARRVFRKVMGVGYHQRSQSAALDRYTFSFLSERYLHEFGTEDTDADHQSATADQAADGSVDDSGSGRPRRRRTSVTTRSDRDTSGGTSRKRKRFADSAVATRVHRVKIDSDGSESLPYDDDSAEGSEDSAPSEPVARNLRKRVRQGGRSDSAVQDDGDVERDDSDASAGGMVTLRRTSSRRRAAENVEPEPSVTRSSKRTRRASDVDDEAHETWQGDADDGDGDDSSVASSDSDWSVAAPASLKRQMALASRPSRSSRSRPRTRGSHSSAAAVPVSSLSTLRPTDNSTPITSPATRSRASKRRRTRRSVDEMSPIDEEPDDDGASEQESSAQEDRVSAYGRDGSKRGGKRARIVESDQGPNSGTKGKLANGSNGTGNGAHGSGRVELGGSKWYLDGSHPTAMDLNVNTAG